MKIRIELTEDILKVIQCIEPKLFDDNKVGVNTKDLFSGGYVIEHIARIIGRFDEKIDKTIYDSSGYLFPKETEDYLWDIYNYISQNIYWIELLIHSHITEGLKPGLYTCIDREKVWTYKPLEK